MRYVVALVVLLLLAGCQGDESQPTGLPDPVTDTRTAIRDAAADRDYEALRPLIKPDRFLSDYGFGNSQPDPIAHWRTLGDKPLRTMEALLQMRHQVRQTNEGTLYQWPRFDANSKPEDITDDERRQLRRVMTEAELQDATIPEYGYTGPRLGILADGTWWFFNLRRDP